MDLHSGYSAWKLSRGYFRLVSVKWHISLGHFRLRASAGDHLLGRICSEPFDLDLRLGELDGDPDPGKRGSVVTVAWSKPVLKHY